jgi:hypothetical protein
MLRDKKTQQYPVKYGKRKHGRFSCDKVATAKFFEIFVFIRDYTAAMQLQWRPLIIIADNVINRLLLSKSVVPKHTT